jgi:hypothetical protein
MKPRKNASPKLSQSPGRIAFQKALTALRLYRSRTPVSAA